jgi:hypothetical protein
MAVLAKVSAAFLAIGALALGEPQPVLAQHITIDGRFSPAQTLVGPNYSIGANLGKQVGTNLFHSFGQFGISHTPTPESATFSGPPTINNVIGRVTVATHLRSTGRSNPISPGQSLSDQPERIVFGPNATVNV